MGVCLSCTDYWTSLGVKCSCLNACTRCYHHMQGYNITKCQLKCAVSKSWIMKLSPKVCFLLLSICCPLFVNIDREAQFLFWSLMLGKSSHTGHLKYFASRIHSFFLKQCKLWRYFIPSTIQQNCDIEWNREIASDQRYLTQSIRKVLFRNNSGLP